MSQIAEQNSIEQAFEKLGFSELPRADFEGLKKLYLAWCLNVPFDNIRKTIAMRTNAEGLLPGTTADDFLDAWREHGTGGTCWPINEALYALIKGAGFDAVRATGSMWDLGIDNHGTIIVRIDGNDWLADAALQTKQPLPLVAGEVFISPDPIYKAEIDPEGDGFFVWATHPPVPHLLPCHLMERNISHEVFSKNYERSREMSPFNAKLYARRNFKDHLRVLAGNKLFEIRAPKSSPPSEGEMSTQSTERASAVTVTELTSDELLAELRGPFGYSDAIIDAWVKCGAHDATMAPMEPPAKPPLTRTPPSERAK